MLVLSRKLQQQIKIGDEITVTVLRVKGNTVRIGVQAPREVRVVRGELPKQPAGLDEQAAVVSEITISASDLSASCREASDNVTETATLEAAADESPMPVRAAHLPLKRVRDRFGAAPLKQVIASCPALAK